jgi:hypothetical protein
MSLRSTLLYAFGLIFCLTIQILFLRNLVFFDYAFCFLYVGAVLVLPPDIDRSLFLLIAFVTGIVLDVFMNTLGLHASATVLVAYLRAFLLSRQERRSGEEMPVLTLRKMGLVPFVTLFFPLVFIHSASLFLIETNSFVLIGFTLLRILASSLYTMLGILIWQSFVK